MLVTHVFVTTTFQCKRCATGCTFFSSSPLSPTSLYGLCTVSVRSLYGLFVVVVTSPHLVLRGVFRVAIHECRRLHPPRLLLVPLLEELFDYQFTPLHVQTTRLAAVADVGDLQRTM